MSVPSVWRVNPRGEERIELLSEHGGPVENYGDRRLVLVDEQRDEEMAVFVDLERGVPTEIDEEVEEALMFTPALEDFWILTTAPR